MRDLGDFQTPPALVAAVLARLGAAGSRWERVLEPTCGRGHFLAGLLALDPPPREVYGIEIQPGHLAEAREVAAGAPGSVRVGLTAGSLFDLDLRTAPGWTSAGPLLVVGNPPWVTSAELGVLGSGNHPHKQNFNNARGIEALTGSSNFDLAEAVWLKLLTELADEQPTVALLCKVSVARRVLEHAAKAGMTVASASLTKLDARVWFGASVEACLLCVTLGPRSDGPAMPARIPVYPALDAAEPEASMGFAGARLVADLDAYRTAAFADGPCPFVWRQGLKHDAASVMELEEGGSPTEGLKNKLGQPVDVEVSSIYPLLKGGDLARPNFDPSSARRAVIVTQRKVGDDTQGLRQSAPKLWAYLEGHDGTFSARKSSVYRGAPPYAMFGVGPYSFSAYKVAVSGLHKAAVFHALGSIEGQPVMLDDTCYLLPASSPEQAAVVAALLNGPAARALLRALSFPGSKRAVTKSVLQRFDLNALLAHADRPALLDRAGADVARLAGRAPCWPERLEELLEPGACSTISLEGSTPLV